MTTTQKKDITYDLTTEKIIKSAAEKIFMEKGFSGARTRDIAKEAGMNIALLNYYFRSKENLFGVIMMEKIQVFFDVIIDILNDENLQLSEKIPKLVNKYTDLLTQEPNLPIFLLSELKQNPDFFANKLNIKNKINKSAIELLTQKKDTESKETAVQLLVTFLGITLFPFIVREVMQNMFDITPERYTKMLNKRRELIPMWASEILKTQFK